MTYTKKQKETVNRIVKGFEKPEIYQEPEKEEYVMIADPVKTIEIDYMPDTLIIEGREVDLKDIIKKYGK